MMPEIRLNTVYPFLITEDSEFSLYSKTSMTQTAIAHLLLADSNSFLIPLEILHIVQENKYFGIF